MSKILLVLRRRTVKQRERVETIGRGRLMSFPLVLLCVHVCVCVTVAKQLLLYDDAMMWNLENISNYSKL